MTQSRIAVNQRVAIARLGDEAVLLHTDSGVYYGLDRVGTVIWGLISEGLSEMQVHESLVEMFDADAEVLRMDLTGFLQQLEERSLISRSAVTAALP